MSDGGHPRSPGFRVGDRVIHRSFGEGLIVEVRERDGFEVLEIAFANGIRRLTSLYPLEPARGRASNAAAGAPALTSAPAAASVRLGLDLPTRGQFRVVPGAEDLVHRLLAGP